MVHTKAIWIRRLTQYKLKKTRSLCTNNTKPTTIHKENEKVERSVSNYNEIYGKLDNLDFMTASKILFTEPQKKKKFGLDFHLVQLFFCCLPSLAVYLVAQYARYDIRKMEAEVEQKKQIEQKKKEEEEEEERLKEAEINATKEAERGSELSEVKARLHKLEEVLKDIVVESKKESSFTIPKNQLAGTQPKNALNRSESTESMEKDGFEKKRHVDASKQD